MICVCATQGLHACSLRATVDEDQSATAAGPLPFPSEVEQLVARRVHCPEVVGSSPTLATDDHVS